MSKINEVRSETKWDEESYARDLARAEAIKGDPKKMAMAVKGAKRLAQEDAEKAKAMKAVASRSPKELKKATKSIAVKKKGQRGARRAKLDPFYS